MKLRNNTRRDVAVVCMPTETDGEPKNYSMEVVHIFGILEFISSAFLFITVVIYLMLKELRDTQGICILHFIFNLSVMYIVLGFIQYDDGYKPDNFCQVKAYTLYFISLCTFFWMNLSSFHIWKSAQCAWHISRRKLVLIYTAIGYGSPLFLLLLAYAAQHIPGNHPKPNFGQDLCWFKEYRSQWYYHHLPMTILLLLNLLYFVESGRKLWINYRGQLHNSRIKSLRYKFTLYLKLFLVMGISWLFEVLSPTVLKDFRVVVIITDVINCLQGLIIFILLIATRKRVIRLLTRHKVCNINCCYPNKWTIVENDDTEEEEQLEPEVQYTAHGII